MPIIIALFFGVVFRDFRHLLRDLIESVRLFCRFFRWYRMGDRMAESERFDFYETVFRDVHGISPKVAQQATIECLRRGIKPQEFRKWFQKNRTRVLLSDGTVFRMLCRVPCGQKLSEGNAIFEVLYRAERSVTYGDLGMRHTLSYLQYAHEAGVLHDEDFYYLRLVVKSRHVWTDCDLVEELLHELRRTYLVTVPRLVVSIINKPLMDRFDEFESGDWSTNQWRHLRLGYSKTHPNTIEGWFSEEYVRQPGERGLVLRTVGGLNIVDATAGVTSPVVMAPQMSEEKARRLADMFIRELQKRK